MIAYIKDISTTQNSKVNYDKLFIELKSSSIPFVGVEPLAGKIYINCSTHLTLEQETELDTYLSNHDGSEPEAFDDIAIAKRENVIRTLNQLAIYSPRLSDNVMTVRYLTSIDNYINAYIRSGINDVLVEKIGIDAANTEGEFFSYLHTVVNEEGNKTYEYFIGAIQGLI